MNYSWTLTDVEFTALWAETKAGPLPTPLIAVSRIKNADRYEAHQLQARERLREMPDLDVPPLVETLAHPDITLALNGWDTRTPGNPGGLIRVHAARSGADGIVVREIPGETSVYSNGFVLTRCHAVELARVAVEQLPVLPAGGLGEMVLVDPDDGLDYSYGRSAVRERAYAAQAPEDRAARFLEAPTERMGGLEILQARSAFGPRGCSRYFLGWRDLPDDGRYLITDDTPSVVVPVDVARLAARINTHIAVIVQTLREERVR